MTTTKTTPLTDHLADWIKRQERYPAIVEKLLADDPSLGITAYIIAGDLLTAEQNAEMVQSGEAKAQDLVWRVGSFARLDWAIKYCSDAFVLENLPRLWVGSDPDDTKPEYLALWRRAFERNGSAIIWDHNPLPFQDEYQVYRGQRMSDPIGISWSLNEDVAQSFAEGAGVRRTLTDGVIVEQTVPRERVLAYLTGRDEDELIVIPEGQ